MNQPLLDLYHRQVGAVFDRQMRLADFLEESGDGSGWGYDVPSAILTFGKAIRFEAHLLGSFAEGNHTWLWAWANRHLNLPPGNRQLAEAVRQLASGADLQLFAADGPVGCDDQLPDELAGEAAHVFGVIVTGILGHDAYYVLPYKGGRGVAVIRDERLRRPEPQPLLRISSVFTQAISGYPIPDHRAAFTAYAESYGFMVRATGEEVCVLSAGGEVMTARFDELNRLIGLECTVPPAGGDAR